MTPGWRWSSAIVGLLLLLPCFGKAEDVFMNASAEAELASFVQQLQKNLESDLEEERVDPQGRLLVVSFAASPSPSRLKLNRSIESHLTDLLSVQTQFAVVQPEFTETHLRTHWKAIHQQKLFTATQQIAEAAQAPLVLYGILSNRPQGVRVQFRMIQRNRQEVITSLPLEFAPNDISPPGLEPVAIYENQRRLAFAKGFMTSKEWDLAQSELEAITPDHSPESQEAEGWLIWLDAKLRRPTTQRLVAFRTLYPDHPLIEQIEAELQKQKAAVEVETLTTPETWWNAKQSLDADAAFFETSEIQQYELAIQEAAVQQLMALLAARNWQFLWERWNLRLQLVTSSQESEILEFQRSMSTTFHQEIVDLIQSKDRINAIQRLDQWGGKLLSTEMQTTLRQEIEALPLPPYGMVTIPAGPFFMGSDSGAKDEKPRHQIELDAFHIDQKEVSNQDYQTCVDAQACTPSAFQQVERLNDPSQPVVGVTWKQSLQYCQWHKKRLPTEAEWEKVAQAIPVEELSDHAWFQANAGGRSRAVGTANADRYGAYDILGNVLEWVQDYYAEDYYGWSPKKGPQGPREGEFRVARGGSWHHSQQATCSYCRFYWSPSLTFEFIGFRCARSYE